MSSFLISFNPNTTTLTTGFNAEQPATNQQLIIDAVSTLKCLKLSGGQLLKITGPCSMPVAFAIAHEVGHLFGAIAIFDPKLSGFLVSISHNPQFKIGDLIS